VEKLLEDALIKLSVVVSDLFGSLGAGDDGRALYGFAPAVVAKIDWATSWPSATECAQ